MYKRLVLFVIVMLFFSMFTFLHLSSTMAQPPALGSNILVNGDFETGAFTGWNVTGVCSISNTTIHSGSYSAYLPSSLLYLDNSITQQIMLPADQSVSFEGWFYPLNVGDIGAHQTTSGISFIFYNMSTMTPAFTVSCCWCWNAFSWSDNSTNSLEFQLAFNASSWNCLSFDLSHEIWSYFSGVDFSGIILYSVSIYYHRALGSSAEFYADDLVLTSPRTIVVPDNYPTIQAAINTADNGDAIFVRNGTYLENVVVNKTLYLIGEDRDNTIIDAERVGSPLTVIANNVSVEGLTLTNAAAGYGNAGIVLDANFCQVSNNMISNCLDRGILVPDNQSHDSFTNDIMTNNTFWGIELHIGDKNNFIAYNNIYENGWGIGVCGGSDNNAIVGNTVENVSRYGIYLSSTSNNVVVGNTVENVQSDESIGMEGEIVNNVLSENTVANCAIGLSIENPSGTILFHIFHNNLINNTIQASVGGTFVNMFDNGYPSGGNYWSDYNGSDVFGGPYQNLTGSDGIGDTPYFIDTCNLDNYPLMNPWSPHDIVVANTVLSKTVVGQGYLDVLSVTVMNAGAFAENFNVTSDAFNLLSGVQSVGGIESVSNLLFNETRFVALGWNTAGLAYGNYTLSVCASPVVGQTNVVNNNCIGGNAVVTIPGDLNGDFKVSLSDLNMLAKAYGSHCANHDYQGEPASPNWNPNADINGGGRVSLSDLTILAKNYGKSVMP